MSKFTTTVRYLPDDLVDGVISWCEQNATQRAPGAFAIGLAYGFGLNMHQIARGRFTDARADTISFPLARRIEEIRNNPETFEIPVGEPRWLALAARELGTAPGLCYRPRRRSGTIRGAHIDQLVREAAAEATGYRISIEHLSKTHHAKAAEAKPVALHGLGYADSYVARLANPQLSLIIPRRAA